MTWKRAKPPRPEIKSLYCATLEHGELPADPRNCAIPMDATIGMEGTPAADIFYFTVITPAAISGRHQRRWGRGYLVLPEFSWSAIEAELQRLLFECDSSEWRHISEQLDRVLIWEYGEYPRRG